MNQNIRKHIIGKLSNHLYYKALTYNNIDSLILFLGLTYLYEYPENFPYTLESYKRELFKVNGGLIAENPGIFESSTYTNIDPERFDIVIVSQFTSLDEQISKLIIAFPEYTKEQLKNYEYRMSVDNYLKILEKFLNFYAAKVPYIILYEDEARKVHCEEYFPTEEEKASNWKAIPSNFK